MILKGVFLFGRFPLPPKSMYVCSRNFCSCGVKWRICAQGDPMLRCCEPKSSVPRTPNPSLGSVRRKFSAANMHGIGKVSVATTRIIKSALRSPIPTHLQRSSNRSNRFFALANNCFRNQKSLRLLAGSHSTWSYFYLPDFLIRKRRSDPTWANPTLSSFDSVQYSAKDELNFLAMSCTIENVQRSPGPALYRNWKVSA